MTTTKNLPKKSAKKSAKRAAPAKKRPYVIVRTYSAGVHCGELVAQDGREVTLANASRIWRWRGANTLHELALRGADTKDHTRISEKVTSILLIGAIEVIPCTAAASLNLGIPRWL